MFKSEIKRCVVLQGSMICNEFENEVCDIPKDILERYDSMEIETFEEFKNEILKRLNYNYYITGFRYIYNIGLKTYIADYDEDFKKIKENEIIF
jgi:hypothetical protein